MFTYNLASRVPDIEVLESGDILNCPYSGTHKVLLLPKGKYKLECWGAQGADAIGEYEGGRGGYAAGILNLTEKTKLYLYTGGQGTSEMGINNGGFNGGGIGVTNSVYMHGSGGGGTDIRIGSDSLYARVLVAGGGGAASNIYNCDGGYGGGIAGSDVYYSDTCYAGGATQTSAGEGISDGIEYDGTFGSAYNQEITEDTFLCGGGGGWYAGASSHAGGAGGSGYIYTADTVSNYPEGCLLNEGYYLEEAVNIDGNSNILDPTTSEEVKGNSGDGYIRITIISIPHDPVTYDITSSSIDITSLNTGDILNCPYSGTYKTLTLPKGKYKLECWGAQGGDANTSYPGAKGGYSVGTLNLTQNTKLYLYSGGKGSTATGSQVSGGFNGGGVGYGYSSYPAGSGGGGTDIRIGSTSLYARVIVAGGGGGANARYSPYNTGYGGGTSGGQCYYNSSYYAYGASQTSAGSGSYASGSFGSGYTSGSTSYVAGGGGGWYGGASAQRTGGGGGSGYVYNSSTASNYPSSCQLNSNYYLTDASTVDGNTSFIDSNGSTVTGRSGNGYIRITIINIESDYDTVYDITDIEPTEEMIVKKSRLNIQYTGSYKSLTLPAGKYKLECWGAQGGDVDDTYIGGRGGYSRGILTLKKKTDLYLFIGGQGDISSGEIISGGFNGGGSARGSEAYKVGSGGGGTDIRIETKSIFSRVIVAGGGGGSMYNITNGGYGGNTSGSNSNSTTGGTQTAAGNGDYIGTFGIASTDVSESEETAGGGGGWYPGGSGQGAGGGSGYVYTSSTISNYPRGSTLSDTYYLSNTSMSSGTHEGDGLISIIVQELLEEEAEKQYLTPTNGIVDVSTSNLDDYILSANDIINCPYSGTYKTIKLPKGRYKLECWGAQGGYRSSTSYGGKGGYSTGILSLEDESTTLYLYSGGSGNSRTTATSSIYPGGFNGGGYRYNYKGGGGGTDIRIGSNSLYARVIVAGGGGSDGNSGYAGGYGGGTSGATGAGGCGSNYGGGSQTASGSSTLTSQQTTNTSSVGGGFGFGGFGAYRSSGYGGAGGGGWYGGSGTYPDGSADDDYAGSGGSGYVYTSSTASSYPSGCLLNPEYYLEEASTINGGSSFKDPSGSTVTGRSGNGYIRITILEIYDNSKVNVENDIDITNIDLIKDMVVRGTRFNIQYTGEAKEITLPKGRYKLECWGAQGGDADDNYIGGRGGYSSGTILFPGDTKLYLYSGGKGLTANGEDTVGGFNGGGSAKGHIDYPAGSGGGSTDIRVENDSLYSRLIVAGGGGGGNKYNAIPGGYGGGTTGYSCIINESYYGNGATQTAAGTGSCSTGSFGSASTDIDNYSAGGGGGWYPGGNAIQCSGGGGSGYVYTSSTASSYPDGKDIDKYIILSSGNTKSDINFGNGRISITVIEVGTGYNYDLSKDEDDFKIRNNDIIDCPYSGNYKTIKLPKGRYKLECWGAQGGDANSTYTGGLGGYSSAIMDLNREYTFYLYAGGKGQTCTGAAKTGGFNGGGSGYGYSGNPAGSGGGGTDIRTSTSVNNRIIVAGGGGGAQTYNVSINGCSGGGEIGDQYYYNSSYYAYGGTQSGAGSGYAAGTVGVGSTSTTSYVAGGGGGYYPGANGARVPGGGGSGYISTSMSVSTGVYSMLYPEMQSGVRQGNGHIRITAQEVDRETTNKYNCASEISHKLLKKGDIIALFDQSTTKQITLPKGRYKLECWGARGGYSKTATLRFYDGGRGGYSSGILNLNEETNLFLNTGTTGSQCSGSIGNGGYNGGGAGYGYSGQPAGSGGGGTDIRIGSNSIYARVIVAGGGGGANYLNYGTTGGKGGNGGGASGVRGYYNSSYYGNGGSQTAAGTSSYATGAFGCASLSSTSYVAGGGGGWYPGGQGNQCPGGGGSGYVYTSSTASSYPSGCKLNSSYYLEDTLMSSGSNTGYGAGRIYITILDIEENEDTVYDLRAITSSFDKDELNINDIIECNYTGSKKTIKLPAGKYKLECWGAQGGDANIPSNYNVGGNGGYSTGIVTLNDKINTLYLYAGGKGLTARGSSTAGGFNGGGYACGYSSYYAGSGGGGTDIRIGSDSLYARVIVAGGGGGANTHYNTTSYPAGTGGGESGTRCYYSSSYYGNAGTQTAAGAGNYSGSFGTASTSNTNYTSGGGGGWYPGGNAQYCSSGGGSGYVYTSSTASSYPSGCLLNPEYYLEEASTTSVSSNALANGRIRITVLDIFKDYNEYDITEETIDTSNLITTDVINCPYSEEVKSITLPPGSYKLECWGSEGTSKGGYSTGIIHLNKNNNTLHLCTGTNGQSTDIRINTNELQNRVIVADGGDDESGYIYDINSIVPYSNDSTLGPASMLEDGTIYSSNSSISNPITNKKETGVSGDGYIRITVLDILPETDGNIYNVYEMYDIDTVNNNDIINCTYTGEAQLITLPKGRYKLECWGAQGGSATGYYNINNYVTYDGAEGGYSSADIVLPNTTSLYLYAGGQGSNATGKIDGGFNGGGPAYGNTSYSFGSGGGGTDIRIDNDSLYSRVIVAGGGGGASSYYNSDDYPAGTGGGESGGKCTYDTTYYANGGTQTAAGTGNLGSGSFGSASTVADNVYTSGSGGGWYGGGNSLYCSGSGGSGYVYSEDTFFDYPEGCTLQANDYLLNSNTVNGSGIGNGKIRITVQELGYEMNRYNISRNEIDNVKLADNDTLICTYTGENKIISLPAGKYKLECWGAQGGDANTSYPGGEGGYSKGIINLSEETKVYLYAGGKGSTAGTNYNTKGGFNGGGYAYGHSSYPAGTGGGGTDIRIGTDSLYARVIVAGGGGGANTYNSKQAGAGGGEIGETVTYNTSYYSNGGTQTAAGTGSYATGSFGKGSTSSTTYVAGGGGGWYPGGSTQYCAAAGGSGYVYTEENSVNYPSGCLLNEEYYLEEAETSVGGKTGHGKIYITCISIDSDYNVYDLSKDNITDRELVNRDRLVCTYTGEAKEITLPKGRYKLECWGAQGGDADNNNIINKGGRGGYATGKLVLKEPTKLYLYSGGQGTTCTGSAVVGGFNGGGSGYGYSTVPAGSGGGGTDIRIGTDSLYARVIVAGGGGGANANYNSTTVYCPAGAGGGEVGTASSYNSSYYAYGGSQVAAGTGNYNGSFGVGSTSTTTYVAGGGGGWYPGANGRYCGGGGGSSYTYSPTSAYNYPSGCLLDFDDQLSETYTEMDFRNGNGKIQITVEELDYEANVYDLSNTSFDPTIIQNGDTLIYPFKSAKGTVKLPAGKYKLECWGGQGGYADRIYQTAITTTLNDLYKPGAKGGYSKGILNLSKETTLYLYAGGRGNATKGSSNVTGGFNGGGNGYGYSGYPAGSGGGGTDIRIGTDSLYTRVIVAGGGGGANSYYSPYNVGVGGNEIGGRSFYNVSYYANGGNRTEAGKGNYTGSFGTASTSTTNYYAGGGGGWYPGGNAYGCGGGGGSSYVYTKDTECYYPNGCLLDDDVYLEETEMQSGVSEGNGYIKITVIDVDSEIISKKEIDYELTSTIPTADVLKVGDKLNCRYSGTYKTLTLPAGKYKLECWGAQGGSTNDYFGGKGGYSKGTLTLKASTTLYLYVGGVGYMAVGSNISGGFNGGGNGCGYNSHYAGSGGGGTDIRIASTSLNNRVIVAGGGGGANSYYSPYQGGSGGAEIGEKRFYSTSYAAMGGSQNGVGPGYYSGSFGTASTSSTSYTSGGGGGWYPGGSAQYCASAGGSGYVYTEYTTSNYPSCGLNSNYFLKDTEMCHNARNGYGRILITVEELGIEQVPENEYTSSVFANRVNVKAGDIITCNYSGGTSSIQLPKGKYLVECWGAQGGDSDFDSPGGKGGYSKGILNIVTNFTNVYLYAGGRGKTCIGSALSGGFNGGGNGCGYNYYPAGSGGGATDVRVGSSSIYSRVIVAGGGGGANTYYIPYDGGAGGGETGESVSYSSAHYSNGGTQTAAGTGSYATGSFGTGSTSTTNYVAGGGGGWYPGGQVQYCGAAGGSGYVYNEDTASNYPSGCTLNSNYYLEESEIIGDVHNGDGKIRITVLEVDTVYNITSTVGTIPTEFKDNDVLRCKYSGTYKAITLPKGYYKLECWGAQGGSATYNGTTYAGGKGGYSVGTIRLPKTCTLYLYVGGSGSTATGSTKAGGFNGGGAAYGYSSYPAGSGGGGTDIRINHNTLYARVIVAGGGGGAQTITSVGAGGYGGGETGESCNYSTSYYSNGGSQTAGGTGNVATGTFGAASSTNGTSYGAGGGGGWYGAGNSSQDSAGGGSGYVYTEANSVNYPSGCQLTEEYYLEEAQTTGNIRTGSGEIVITVLKDAIPLMINTPFGWADNITGVFVKTENGWEELKENYQDYLSNLEYIRIEKH